MKLGFFALLFVSPYLNKEQQNIGRSIHWCLDCIWDSGHKFGFKYTRSDHSQVLFALQPTRYSMSAVKYYMIMWCINTYIRKIHSSPNNANIQALKLYNCHLNFGNSPSLILVSFFRTSLNRRYLLIIKEF